MFVKVSLNNKLGSVEVQGEDQDRDQIVSLAKELLAQFGGDSNVSESVDKPAGHVCGIHNVDMLWRAPGVSKTTGKPYRGFWCCPQKDTNGKFCNYKPS